MNFNFFKKVLQILSSKVFLLWLAGIWIIYYVLSFIWTEGEVFAGFVTGIRGNALVQAPYIVFLISGGLNLFRASREKVRKGKTQFLLWVMLPAGFFIFLGAFFMSLHGRQAGQSIVGQGDLVRPPWVSEGYTLVRIEPGLRQSILDRDEKIGIFAHEPELTFLDGFSGEYRVGAFPPVKLGDTYYHILNIGIAPGIRLMERDRVISEGYMPLRILMPGSSDFFELPPLPYRFLVTLEPEKTLMMESGMASRFNLDRPRYGVRVFSGERLLKEGDSLSGILFDTFTLRFFEPSYWVLLEAVKDPAMPLLRAGLLLMAAGIPAFISSLILNSFRKKTIGSSRATE